MPYNSSNSRHNGLIPGQHRAPEVVEQSCPLSCPLDERPAEHSDTVAFKVFMKRNLSYQAIPNGALADLRARIDKIKNE